MHVDAIMAGEQACEQVASALAGVKPDLAMLFVSGGHARHLPAIADVVRRGLSPGAFLAVNAESVLGGDVEVEKASGVSLFAAAMPGTTIHPFTYRQFPHVGDETDESLQAIAEVMGAQRDMRATFFLGDPFSVPTPPLVDAMSKVTRVVPGLQKVQVFGGLASGGTSPGSNTLIINDEVTRVGGVGVTIRGAVSVDAVVSQGCRPIGKPWIITEGERNVMRKLGGRPALEVLRETVDQLDEKDRALLPNGVFLGRVVNEYKARFGRGDFIIRGIMGIDQGSGAVAVGDNLRKGQTVQFHLRDATTASEDLKLLLDAQQLQSPPAGGLLFTCNGRGAALFNERHHDARTISQALSPNPEQPMPLGGFFASGEIGPMGPQSYVHGHTAVLALFRPARRVQPD